MNLLNTLLIFCLAPCLGATTINAQNVNIPDANFKAYLLGNAAINTNNDAEIQVSEASAFSEEIDCHNMSITDLTGIEAFVNLRKLLCYKNNLSSLNVTQNTNLIWLHCVNNSISSLDLSQNTGLVWLYCSNNPISNLNLTLHTSLVKLYCSATQLSSLDLSQNPNLAVLDCSSNQQLTSLNVKNGTNTIIRTFKTINDPNLSCIDVDNATYSTANWTNIGGTTSFSTSCTAQIVYIPDANFKAYLVGNAAINTDGDTEIQISEALAFNGAINCPSLNITNLIGIEAFQNITTLNCSYNSLSRLDVTQNTDLTSLSCHVNQLSRLDLTQNTNLTLLSCYYNLLRNLDVTQNPSLTDLKCEYNQLRRLDLTQNTNLTLLWCHVNRLRELDLTQNTRLVYCYLFNNELSSLDVTQNISLTHLDGTNNLLTDLDARNGNNTTIVDFKFFNNSSLSCIEVDDSIYSTTNWLDIDSTTSFSNNCNLGARIAQHSNNTMDNGTLGEETTTLTPINLSVYPNPTTKEIALDFDKIYEAANIQITNLRGQLVLSKQVENSARASLELEGPAGLYFVNIQTEEGRTSVKVIKQ